MIWRILAPGWIRSALLWAAGAAVAVLGIWTAGKREARQKAAMERLEADAKARDAREKIDNDVQDDPDLVRRARDAGVVRKRPGK